MLTDRELFEVIRDFRSSDWRAIHLVHDELDIRLIKRHADEPIPAMDAALRAADDQVVEGPLRESAPEHALQPDSELADASIDGASPQDLKASSTGPRPEGTTVDAPTVGVFWVAPAPGQPPFVEPGDHVKANQQLAIVELMKLMTEIRAKEPGVVAEVLAKNGESVEAGQPLFRVIASGSA